MSGKAISTTTVAGSVKQTTEALEGVLTNLAAKALNMSGPQFKQGVQRHLTPDGFRHTYEHRGTVGSNELQVNLTVEFDARKEQTTIKGLETGPDGAVISTTTTIAAAPQGKSSVTVSGEIPEAHRAQYKSYVDGTVFGGVSRALAADGVGR